MNGETKQTAVEWEVVSHDNTYGGSKTIRDKASNVYIAEIKSVLSDVPEGLESNARLIAAAPELLAALEAVVRVADRATDEFEMARAAIAKAKGERQ